ncbi:mannose-1-phosphate guanylyltransferase [Pleomorphovibrio marinus]|uniref:mannose-1-phosphate guanylyltransferase n=1 Tax=Pleomorphovibrio marinus TaxID=2164132 RepID=UPI000E0A0398|nr:sugar phosphate nucleotidyltransferase [Pleomorphovibrio marinus]
MKQQPYIVILAGGLGIKFWPQSRYSKPKQFLDLLGIGRTLLQLTYERFLAIYPKERFLVVTNKKYVGLVKEQLPELNSNQILVEPLRRNTAASIALASYKIKKLEPDAKVIVSPSDQLIFNEAAFNQSIDQALLAAELESRLLTVGIRPNRPDTSYGYIQYVENPQTPAQKVKTFTEKPGIELAQTFMDSGDFVWNSGMFAWKNTSIISAIEKHLPELAEVFEEGSAYFCTPEEEEFLRKAYSLIKNISIDHGVLEKSDSVYVILGDFGWSDLGSWQNLYDHKNKDKRKNVLEANALLYDSENCFVQVAEGKLVVVQGLKNYLISENGNVLLICKLNEEDRFREFLTDAKKRGGEFI